MGDELTGPQPHNKHALTYKADQIQEWLRTDFIIIKFPVSDQITKFFGKLGLMPCLSNITNQTNHPTGFDC